MSVLLSSDALVDFARRVFEACGAPPQEATIVAEHLVRANLMGYDTHGIIRIPQYVEDVGKGVIHPGAPSIIDRETETTAVVDCGWNFGQVGGLRAMEVAISKARVWHTAMVVASHCSHAGRLGTYTEMAAEKGFFAFAVCNSPRHGHFVLPWGGREGRLATNPLSFAIPLNGEYPVVADFSTAETSEGFIRLSRNQGRALPPGTIVDAEGRPTTDASDFYGPPRGAILPFGGAKGYRGYALSLLVEILGGLLAGSSMTQSRPGNGLAFIVADISAFLPADEFAGLMEELREYVKSSPPAPGAEVMLPGEPDYRKSLERLRDGIPVDESTWEQVCATGDSLGVKCNETVSKT